MTCSYYEIICEVFEPQKWRSRVKLADMSCRTSTKGLLVPAVHFSKLLMWEMYWWAHELNMFQIITKLFPAYEIFNTRNIPTIQAKSPQTLFLTIHNPLVNGRPSRKLLSSRETTFSNVLYAFFLIFCLMLFCFICFDASVVIIELLWSGL